MPEVASVRRAAELGDADAEFRLGILYALGRGVAQDTAEAVRWFGRASEEGHALADALLGSSASLAEAHSPEQIRDAADNADKAGDKEAAGRLRRAAESVEANREAVLFLRHAAEAGHPTAQALLGRIGALQEDAEAETWVGRAVAQDDAWGHYYLGLMYYKGFGVPEDTAEAIRLWKQAADQGLSRAAADIGLLYLAGIDVEEDEDEAARWYRRAVELERVDTNLVGSTGQIVDDCGLGDAAMLALRAETLGTLPRLNDEAEVAEVRRTAEKGAPEAQLKMALLTDTPDGSAESVAWMRRAAEQGVVLAQLLLGAMYDTGSGIREDNAGAVRWFRCAERRLRTAAERGDSDAQYFLGRMYEEGEGVLENFVEAERWYRSSAEGGHVLAQFSLGNIYELGRPRKGIPENEPEAARFYRMAAENGHAYSDELLGRMYETEKDATEVARLWRAANQGHVGAQYELGHKYDTADGVWYSGSKAAKWYRRAAHQGHADAQYELGTMYRYEHGHFGQNLREAARWFRLAAEKGHADAQYGLGLMYGVGAGFAEDDAEAARWYRLAADQGHAGAQTSLGFFVLLDGSDSEAARWFHLAAEQGDREAQFQLGRMTGFGAGVEQDFEQAVTWFRKAAEKGHAEAQEVLDSIELWRCFKPYDRGKTTLLTLTRLTQMEGLGQVSSVGVAHSASFHVRGLDLRWNFGHDARDGSYDYALVIQPDGGGLYYDFSRSADGTATPSQTFRCERSP